jgi:two-component system, cell cycle response regulator
VGTPQEKADEVRGSLTGTFLRPDWPAVAPSADEPRNAYLTVLNGKLVGRTYRIGAGRLILGRADDCDIVLDDEGVSRRHALFVVTPDRKVTVEDFGSTNGTLVEGKLVSVRELRGGERLMFGSDTVVKFEFRDSIEEDYATYLYESATRDRLTGVFNERYLREQLELEFTWHHRHCLPLSLIFLDIDHFKSINDVYGHLAGDEALKQVAQRCHAASRGEDVFARCGGEEFACLLRRTPLRAAVTRAERMRCAVENTSFRFIVRGEEHFARVTISAGVALLNDYTPTAEALIAEADRYLYAAKNAGRNRVMTTAE